MSTDFHQRALNAIKGIPKGKVATYGQIAAIAGNPNGARQVSRILHSCWRKEKLPWHRVVNRQGKISLGRGSGFEIQKALLEKDGVIFVRNENIDLDQYLWSPL